MARPPTTGVIGAAIGCAASGPFYALCLLLVLLIAAIVAAVAALVISAVVAVILAINLRPFYRTLVSDRTIELRDHVLHVPVVTLFQRRPWDIPLSELVSISAPRKSGGSTKLLLALRDGRTHVFSASVVEDRYALISAIERRIGNPQIG